MPSKKQKGRGRVSAEGLVRLISVGSALESNFQDPSLPDSFYLKDLEADIAGDIMQ